MSAQVIALLALGGVFLVATVTSVNMGALALVAAFVIGGLAYGVPADDVLSGFPGSMFVILVGVTYLFALAKNNGTVDWLVHAAVRAVGGRISLVPLAMFLIPAAITSIGAAAPAACAITIPVALRFAQQYRIRPLLMSMMVIQGTTAGGFSPIAIYGVIVHGVTDAAGLPSNPGLLYLGTFGATALLGVIAFLTLGGRDLIGRRDETDSEPLPASAAAGEPPSGPSTPRLPGARGVATSAPAPIDIAQASRLTLERASTLAALLVLVVATLVFDLHVGMVALTIAVVLTLVFPATARTAVEQVAWSTVLLIGGIMTYVAMLEEQGTIDWLGRGIAGIGVPLLAAFVLLLIGAVVSAFASTTALLGAVIPLATPFLLNGDIGVLAVVVALCVSSSVVDCSPLSTMGALAVANAPADQRDKVFGGLMVWGMSLVVIAPVVSWTVLVLPAS
ncbi:hypothetical protein BAY59_26220 [Prauserella coralliicola]|nr:hypothetical protein BAY59_26220 [Prauserella coralliicola]